MTGYVRRSVGLAALAGVLFWVTEALLDAYVLRLGAFPDTLLPGLRTHELHARLGTLLVIVAAGAGIGIALGRQGRLELARRESQRTLATLMSNLPGMAYRCRNDRDWTMEFVSDGCADLTGHPAGDLLHNARVSYNDLIHPDDREAVWREVQAALAEGRPFELNYRLVRADGEERQVWERGRGVMGGGPAPVALEGFITDVTKQKRAEQGLRGYAERLRTLREIDTGILAARSPAAIAQAAVERMARLVPCSRGSVVLFDLARRECEVLAVCQDGRTRLGPRVRAPIDASFGDLDALRAGLAREVPDVEALPAVPPLLSELAAEGIRSVVVMPLVAGGELMGALNLGARHAGAFSPEMIDIAREVAMPLAVAIRQSRLHEQLAQEAERLELRVQERTADLEAFAHSISHDLRAPLRAIDGFAAALDEHARDGLDEEGRRLLRIVRGNASGLRQLLDDLLAFYRLGQAPVASAEVDLAALAREAFAQVRAQEPARALRLELGPLPPARGDPAMIRLALGNLLANAVKFTRPRAQAVVEVGAETASPGAPPVYYVRDNGVGFDPAQSGRLFGVFNRLHPAEQFEGTGVGLAIVRRVVERHGGRIWAESAPDRGATFRFTLAAAAALEARA